MASSASALSSSAWRSCCRIYVELGAGSSPSRSAGDALDLGIGRRVRADGAGELADTDAVKRARDAHAVALEREGPTRELKPEVVGSTCTPCVRPIVSVSRCSFARRITARCPIEACHGRGTGLAELERERRVEDVRRGEAVVEEPAVLAQLLRDRVDEGRDVVLRLRLELGDAGSRRRRRAGGDGVHLGLGNDANLGPGRQSRQFDFEPPREPRFVRPDPGHRRTG